MIFRDVSSLSLSSVNLRALCGLCLFLSGVSELPCRSFAQQAYLGFDRNAYPGDENLTVLRKTFAYSGYWLNNPPGESTNSWTGKRVKLESAGLGFLVLFNGRLYKQLKHNPSSLGQSDGNAAVASARHEGFPAHAIIFLDIEEGGRMLPEQKAYVYAWVDAVIAAGFRAGVYCSGIPAKEGNTSVVTADDIRASAQGRNITYWVTNDVCPPSPGCGLSNPPNPARSGVKFADVWQFAQSPRRPDFATMCRNYSRDGNCYPPGVDPATHLHVDVNTANRADPSQGAGH
jgi:hypothetical protein